MESLKVQQGDKLYLLYNLTIQSVREFQIDSQKLNTYFNNCLENQQNICILEDEKNLATNQLPNTASFSTSSNAFGSHQNRNKFSFLCGNLRNKNYIYAIKSADFPWHYFDLCDTNSSDHVVLPAKMLASINKFVKNKSITVSLNEVQSQNYFQNGKFIFKNKILKTQIEINGKQIVNKKSETKCSDKTTKQLVFISGQSNPLMFLKDFENCRDFKNEHDKIYKIIDFVDDSHKAEFNKLYFSSDWVTVKSHFLKLYTVQFVENKKRELNIDFDKAECLRSFFDRKLTSLSKFTTLPFINQVEIVMNDLPVEVSSMLIMKGKMTGDKSEILNFCDSIQHLLEYEQETPQEHPNENDIVNQPSDKMQMEIFNYVPESETSEAEPMSVDPPQSTRGRCRGRGRGGGTSTIRGIKKRGRPPKKLIPIKEDDESSGYNYNYLEEMDNSSQSTWSEKN